jgi:hypothetical protein
MEGTHIPAGQNFTAYNTTPPNSGPHWNAQGLGPINWGVYTTQQRNEGVVHNLEHGGVIVQYGSAVSQRTVDRITEWYRESPNALVVAPLPKLGKKVVLTSWQHMMTCSGFDEKAFRAFRTAHRYNGPEKFPPAALQPGS